MRALLALVLVTTLMPAWSAAAVPAMRTANCASRSEAVFPNAFTSRRNLVMGPLSLVDAATVSPVSIEHFGGWKSPAVARAGRTVTVRVARAARSWVTVTYPHGRPSYGVRFVACRRGVDSGSRADGRPVTFWSGFFALRNRDRGCIPLRIRVDGGRWRRRTLAVATTC